MKQDEFRQKLLDGTIRIIARDGLNRASTKLIGSETCVNEAYIYRCFKDKEDMFAKAFDVMDEELLEKTLGPLSVMSDESLTFKIRSKRYFDEIWNFLLSSKDKCLAYVQYFYSPFFTKYSAENHEKRFAPLLKVFRPAFKDEADVWMILNHILNVMLDFAVKVHNDHMPNNEVYSEHVFRVIYESVKQYFRWNEGSEEGA